MQPANKVIKRNGMLKDYDTKNNIVYLDYFNGMKDERNGLPANLSHDGVHPNYRKTIFINLCPVQLMPKIYLLLSNL